MSWADLAAGKWVDPGPWDQNKKTVRTHKSLPPPIPPFPQKTFSNTLNTPPPIPPVEKPPEVPPLPQEEKPPEVPPFSCPKQQRKSDKRRKKKQRQKRNKEDRGSIPTVEEYVRRLNIDIVTDPSKHTIDLYSDHTIKCSLLGKRPTIHKGKLEYYLNILKELECYALDAVRNLPNAKVQTPLLFALVAIFKPLYTSPPRAGDRQYKGDWDILEYLSAYNIACFIETHVRLHPESYPPRITGITRIYRAVYYGLQNTTNLTNIYEKFRNLPYNEVTRITKALIMSVIP